MSKWTRIKLDYIRGYTDKDGKHQRYTQEDLAAKYHVSRQVISVRAASEGWREERAQVEQQIYKRAVAAYEGQAAEALASIDALSANAAMMALAHIVDRMEHAASTREMDDLVIKYAKVIGAYQKAGRLALGVSIEATQPQEQETLDYDLLAEAYGITALSDEELKQRREQLQGGEVV